MSQQPIEPIVDPTYDVCLWPVDPACLTEDWNNLPPADQHRALALASMTLRRLTAYRVDNCPIVVRPCKPGCASNYGRLYYDSYGANWMPHIDIEGDWVNACGCTSDCACGPMCEINLPGPVVEVLAVDVNGVAITDFKVQGTRLVYTGTGDCPFPTCQNLAAAPGEEGTFTVTYRNTYPVDGLGAYAAGILAMEYAKMCSGKGCRLPVGTTQVNRNGVTIEIQSGAFPNGLTGIREVDGYIALWRPEGSPKKPPRIWSPGTRLPRVERA